MGQNENSNVSTGTLARIAEAQGKVDKDIARLNRLEVRLGERAANLAKGVKALAQAETSFKLRVDHMLNAVRSAVQGITS